MVYLRGDRVWCNGNPRRPPDLKATDRFGTRAPICKGIFCRRKLLLVLPPIIEHVLIFLTQSYNDAALHNSAKIQSQIGKNTTQTSSTMIITPRFHSPRARRPVMVSRMAPRVFPPRPDSDVEDRSTRQERLTGCSGLRSPR